MSSKGNAIFSSALCKSLPYLMCLLLCIVVPYVLSDELRTIINIQEPSLITAFLGTMLAIAGVFLTLFYTSMLSAYSSKFPDGNALISGLFAKSISEESSLQFCNAYVVTSIFALVSLAFVNPNRITLIYMGLLSIILVSKIPSVVKLFAHRTELDFISRSVGNKLLSAAYAASLKYDFSKSPALMDYFKRIANSSLSDLHKIMEFAIAHEERNHGDATMVADLILQILGKYETVRSLIPDESSWQPNKSIHRSWFESDFYEISIAISTGTIPSPKIAPNPNGIEKRLLEINGLYRHYLINNNDMQRYAHNSMYIDIIIEHSIKNGNVAWLSDIIPPYHREMFEFASGFSANSRDEFLMQSELLEAYAVSAIGIPLNLAKLILKVDPNDFKHGSFSSFSRNELLRKGYPIANCDKAVNYCKCIERELFIADKPVTPKWHFEETMNGFATCVIKEATSFSELLFGTYTTNLMSLIAENPKPAYILALKETELYSKLSNCLAANEFLAKQLGCEDINWLKEAKDRIDSKHDTIQSLYPKIVDGFQEDQQSIKEFFPDVYGFAYFNYCNLMLKDIMEKNLDAFESKMSSLFFIVVFASNDLRDDLLKKPYSDQYKAQIILSPLEYFFELCGMAYAIAELIEEYSTQEKIATWISEHLVACPEEKWRWETALDINDNVFLGGSVSMVISSWRRNFINAAQSDERYPPQYDVPFYRQKTELSGKHKRLCEMFPSDFSGINGFNGCKVFRKFIFEPVIDNIGSGIGRTNEE